MNWTLVLVGEGESQPEFSLRELVGRLTDNGLQVTEATYSVDGKAQDLLKEKEVVE